MSDAPPSFPNDCCPNQKSCTCFDWDNITVPRAQYEAMMAAVEVLANIANGTFVFSARNEARDALAALRAAGIDTEGKT